MIKREVFGFLQTGERVEQFTLKNSTNSVVKIINYGARIVSWNFGGINVILGYDNLADYEKDTAYKGAIVGRCANRIGNATFMLNGKKYELDKNNGNNHLHGGFSGFESKIWEAEILTENSLKLSLFSPDGEGGYPANLKVEVIYTFTDNNELEISYQATADADTICNLTNHSYFNLNGEGDILAHSLQIFADNYTWANEESIPDGRILTVQNTPLDFRELRKIGERINDDFDQLNYANGYDHNYCINDYDGSLKKAATVIADKTGIKLSVYTTSVGMHFYAGNFLEPARSGFALETQFFPDAINKANFLSPILKVGEIFKAKTVYALN